MATKYQISTEFSVVDRASAQLNKMGAAGGVVGRAWSRGIADAQVRLDAFGKSVAAAGKMAVGLGVGAIGAGLAVATRQYADYDQAMRGVIVAVVGAFLLWRTVTTVAAIALGIHSTATARCSTRWCGMTDGEY